MLNPDEEIKYCAQSVSLRGRSVSRFVESLEISGAKTRLDGVSTSPLWGGFRNGYKNYASGCLSVGRQEQLRTRVHGAGMNPNLMNRFMLSNSHEVLFVN